MPIAISKLPIRSKQLITVKLNNKAYSSYSKLTMENKHSHY